jgi:integrase
MPDFRIPRMTHHKASDQAVVRLSGQDFYLGPWRSRTAKIEYDRRIAEWLANGRRPPAGEGGLKIVQILADFMDHAQVYYRLPDGSPSTEIDSFRYAMKPLRRLYGHTLADEFGPLALKVVRQAMIEQNWCRSHVNHQIGRIKRIFKWAVENEKVSPSVLHGLQAVAGLRAGRADTRESEPVKPVSEQQINETLPLVSRQVGAMIRLQQLAGMRPGEVTSMRGIDIDMSGKLWVYRPLRHKTQYLGHERMIFLGPKAQDIIRPFLKTDLTAFLFSPAEAEAERREKLHKERKTPLFCGNKPGSNVKRRPRKNPADRYGIGAYARAITYACSRLYPLPPHLHRKRRADGRMETPKQWQARLAPNERAEIKAWRKMHNWHPHQLRHAAATNLRKAYGLEPAQVILGHKTLTVTQVYAEKNVEAAMRIMAEVG